MTSGDTRLHLRHPSSAGLVHSSTSVTSSSTANSNRGNSGNPEGRDTGTREDTNSFPTSDTPASHFNTAASTGGAVHDGDVRVDFSFPAAFDVTTGRVEIAGHGNASGYATASTFSSGISPQALVMPATTAIIPVSYPPTASPGSIASSSNSMLPRDDATAASGSPVHHGGTRSYWTQFTSHWSSPHTSDTPTPAAPSSATPPLHWNAVNPGASVVAAVIPPSPHRRSAAPHTPKDRHTRHAASVNSSANATAKRAGRGVNVLTQRFAVSPPPAGSTSGHSDNSTEGGSTRRPDAIAAMTRLGTAGAVSMQGLAGSESHATSPAASASGSIEPDIAPIPVSKNRFRIDVASGLPTCKAIAQALKAAFNINVDEAWCEICIPVTPLLSYSTAHQPTDTAVDIEIGLMSGTATATVSAPSYRMASDGNAIPTVTTTGLRGRSSKQHSELPSPTVTPSVTARAVSEPSTITFDPNQLTTSQHFSTTGDVYSTAGGTMLSVSGADTGSSLPPDTSASSNGVTSSDALNPTTLLPTVALSATAVSASSGTNGTQVGAADGSSGGRRRGHGRTSGAATSGAHTSTSSTIATAIDNFLHPPVTTTSNSPSPTTITSTFAIPSTVAATSPTTALNTLIVEDETTIRRSVARMLKSLGHAATCVADGRDYPGLVEPQPPTAEFFRFDVIFLDIVMPRSNGIDIARWIRSRGYTGVIIAMTANTTIEDIRAYMTSGFDDILPKPFTFSDLSDRLQHALAQRKSGLPGRRSKDNVVSPPPSSRGKEQPGVASSSSAATVASGGSAGRTRVGSGVVGAAGGTAGGGGVTAGPVV